ncbi:MAG: NUDIX domain-containing protein [Oscillospiraceae bacterium]|nr:NUDIX domain-containing protein [Oscillospiraceae bacterium]
MHIRVSARAIVIHDEHILLNRFFDGVTETYYTVGGGMEPGETAREAVVRETFEESGLHVVAKEHLCTFEYEPARLDCRWGTVHHMGLYFLCELAGSAEIMAPSIPDNEHVHAVWVPLAKLPTLPFGPAVIFPSLLRFVQTGVFSPSYFEDKQTESST